MFCPNCGTEFNSKFCPECGFAANNVKMNDTVSEETNVMPEPDPIPVTYNYKKTHSSLSCISCVLAGVGFLIPLPVSLAFILLIAALITGLIDLCLNDKLQKHIGSWFGVIASILCIITIVEKYNIL